MDQLDDLTLHACQWARQAGAIQLEYFRSGHLDVRTKLNESDIVTKADRASDTFLRERIAAVYPGHAILTEESGETCGPEPFRWIIDPLDGTTNYTAGLPFFAVSIGIEQEGRPVAGVVYAPYLDELFHAVRGRGAWLNGKQIHVRDNNRIDRAVVSTGFPVDKNVNPDNNLAPFARVLPLVRGVRRLGAASVDLCYVAAGFLDAYWEMNLHDWDIAAGALIVEEAGGIVSHYRDDRNRSILASTPALHPLLLEQITKTH
ncbi:MAG: inositol monophosphatase [Clostridium sp.]|nr:inositol monophosphatase [Clostridium sp.]